MTQQTSAQLQIYVYGREKTDVTAVNMDLIRHLEITSSHPHPSNPSNSYSAIKTQLQELFRHLGRQHPDPQDSGEAKP